MLWGPKIENRHTYLSKYLLPQLGLSNFPEKFPFDNPGPSTGLGTSTNQPAYGNRTRGIEEDGKNTVTVTLNCKNENMLIEP